MKENIVEELIVALIIILFFFGIIGVPYLTYVYIIDPIFPDDGIMVSLGLE